MKIYITFNFNVLCKIFFLTSVFFIAGCNYYSWDEGQICPFGKDTYETTNYKRPILVDIKGKKLSSSAQRKIFKSASEFSQNLINQTYDTAKILCQQKGLTDQQYEKLLVSTNLYADAVAVPPIQWDNNGKYYHPDFYHALAENDDGRIITTTLCVVGICSEKDHTNFCKTNDRPYLNNKNLNKILTEFYLRDNKVEITYPFDKTLSRCSGPKW